MSLLATQISRRGGEITPLTEKQTFLKFSDGGAGTRVGGGFACSEVAPGLFLTLINGSEVNG